jgi:AraC family transcriptional regulator, positive regulator of tynA and feaB
LPARHYNFVQGAQFETAGPHRWSTEEVEPRRALAYWVDTVCSRFLELEIDTPLREGFRAHLEQAELGAATVNFIAAESQRIVRTQAKIAHSRYPVFFLLQLRAGRMRLRQLGRDVDVRARESILIDGTEPYELECPEATDALALRLPEHWLKRWIVAPQRYAGRVFGVGGWSGTLNTALANLELDSLDQLALPQGAVAEQIAALLALAVGRDASQSERPSLFDELMRTLRDRLHEPNLSPIDVALQHRISKRSLHYVFARAGTTFIEQLMRLRLDRAREILSDPRLASLPISEVAAQCGFADPSHFARRYRRQFAQAPLESRQMAVRH